MTPTLGMDRGVLLTAYGMDHLPAISEGFIRRGLGKEPDPSQIRETLAKKEPRFFQVRKKRGLLLATTYSHRTYRPTTIGA